MSGSAVVSYNYSLAAQCGSEIIGTCLVIYLGESIIANELLSKTKGARMGWLAVALGFGLSFGVVIMMLGYISAHLNPATCLALWVVGKIPFTHFLALSGAEFAGAFVGACLVFLHYLPHFKNVPEPMAPTADDMLLRSRDALFPEALHIASYDTRRRQPPGGVKAAVIGAIDDLRYYFTESHQPPEEHTELVQVALGPAELKGRDEAAGGLRRRSVQVCDVHRRLQDMSLQEFREKLHLKAGGGSGAASSASSGGDVANPGRVGNGSSGVQRSASASAGLVDLNRGSAPYAANGGGGKGLTDSSAEEAEQDGPGGNRRLFPVKGIEGAASQLAAAPHTWREAYERHVAKFGEKQGKVYDAAVVADQNAKLSIFATRPAIYTPVFNFLCEVMCTSALIFGALMLFARRDQLPANERALFQSYEGMWIGFFVFVVILGLGGPTGIAANPARDFSPRLAHALLPITGKGPSEWYYAWIPFLAPFAGGAIAGGLYLAVQNLNQSNVV